MGLGVAPVLREAPGLPGRRRQGRRRHRRRGRRFSSVLPQLRVLLDHDPSPEVRTGAAVALGRLGGPRDVAALIRRTAPSNPTTLRRTCVGALGELGDPSAVPALTALLDEPTAASPSSAPRRWCGSALPAPRCCCAVPGRPVRRARWPVAPWTWRGCAASCWRRASEAGAVVRWCGRPAHARRDGDGRRRGARARLLPRHQHLLPAAIGLAAWEFVHHCAGRLRRARRDATQPAGPAVSVIVPAYNEEAGIVSRCRRCSRCATRVRGGGRRRRQHRRDLRRCCGPRSTSSRSPREVPHGRADAGAVRRRPHAARRPDPLVVVRKENGGRSDAAQHRHQRRPAPAGLHGRRGLDARPRRAAARWPSRSPTTRSARWPPAG